jgi:tetrahydromethanopterin S-methyltransferase subunit G
MALLDTFSFVKSFRTAGSDEEKAAAIASLVNGLVESNGAAAATRADLARVAGDIVKIEQKVSSMGEELAAPVTQKLGETSSSLVKDMSALRDQMQQRLASVEEKLERLNTELGNRVEMNTDKVGGAAGKVIFWNFILMLLIAAGAFYAALNWPMISGMARGLMGGAPAAVTAPADKPAQPPEATPAPAQNSGN